MQHPAIWLLLLCQRGAAFTGPQPLLDRSGTATALRGASQAGIDVAHAPGATLDGAVHASFTEGIAGAYNHGHGVNRLANDCQLP